MRADLFKPPLFANCGDNYDGRLQCHVESIAYNMKNHTGYIQIPDGECVDKNAAINLFRAIDPAVYVIHAGDTTYVRCESKSDKWATFDGANSRTYIRCAQGHPMEVHPFFSGRKAEKAAEDSTLPEWLRGEQS